MREKESERERKKGGEEKLRHAQTDLYLQNNEYRGAPRVACMKSDAHASRFSVEQIFRLFNTINDPHTRSQQIPDSPLREALYIVQAHYIISRVL
ncbi:hypothetical protein PUN28_004749 [Cardiocondyla obscurior]|uniref:Uncharacterized protein n=1 Tax=Cardiocondyla obscurior TaxID=286306 RepID=A0AAW2GF53_9HYME